MAQRVADEDKITTHVGGEAQLGRGEGRDRREQRQQRHE
jgi:hypothetical protein